MTTASTPRVRIVDVGVGASAIYPLLGAAVNPEWEFLGTEVDPVSAGWAQDNVDANPSLKERIKIKLVKKDTFLVGNLDAG